MRLRASFSGIASVAGLGSVARQWRRELRLAWHRTNKAAWVFVASLTVVFAAFGFVLHSVIAERERRDNAIRAHHEQNLDCLARNVYYEARGEPAAGQYAVAEVTMNRTASQRYPDTVCAVVYQRNWDPLRRRHVAAFSWTELAELDEPRGEAWSRAKEIAEKVYYQRHTPALGGAMFFHATYVRPDWAREKQRVARIGKHIFYK